MSMYRPILGDTDHEYFFFNYGRLSELTDLYSGSSMRALQLLKTD